VVEVHLKQLPNCAAVPQRMRNGDAAADLTAATDAELAPGERMGVPTGVAVAIPLGWCGLILPRSGMTLNKGVTVLNAPGLIDSGYRGEIVVILHNASQETVRIDRGNRIAQLIISEVPAVSFVESDELPDAPDDRGSAGFGSSGF
jgi:dUTP pyrophosphatase